MPALDRSFALKATSCSCPSQRWLVCSFLVIHPVERPLAPHVHQTVLGGMGSSILVFSMTKICQHTSMPLLLCNQVTAQGPNKWNGYIALIDPLSPGTHGHHTLWRKEARWGLGDAREERPVTSIGCHLPWYIRPFPCNPCGKGSRAGGQPSWEGKNPEVRPSWLQPLFCSNRHQNIRGIWARGHILHQGAGSQDQIFLYWYNHPVDF